MNADINPYTPGAGKAPLALVGKTRELEDGSTIISRTARGAVGDASIYYGLRGVGKTVLLKALQQQSTAADWMTVEIEGKQDSSEQRLTRQRLARGLLMAARSVATRRDRMSEAWKRTLENHQLFRIGRWCKWSRTEPGSPAEQRARRYRRPER